jgi:hypothetical protein
VATLQITKVRTIRPAGTAHEHITNVELENSPLRRIPRETVVANLRSISGDRYYTYGGGMRADVIAITCPLCNTKDYITTKPDQTKSNNLLRLPRF